MADPLGFGDIVTGAGLLGGIATALAGRAETGHGVNVESWYAALTLTAHPWGPWVASSTPCVFGMRVGIKFRRH